MAYNICIATGLGDFTPNEQEYHSFNSWSEMKTHIDEFARDTMENDDTFEDCYYYEFPSRDSWPDASSVSFRLLIARDTDMVIDIIGMSDSEYEAQA